MLACLFVKAVRSELSSLKYSDRDGHTIRCLTVVPCLEVFWAGPISFPIMALLPLPALTVKKDGTVAHTRWVGMKSRVCVEGTAE